MNALRFGGGLLLLAALVLVLPLSVGLERLGDRPVPRLRLPSMTEVRQVAVRSRRWFLAATTVLVATAAFLLGGPVAAAVGSLHAVLLARGFVQHARTQLRAAQRARALDDLGALAADLRAGARAGIAPVGAGKGIAPIGAHSGIAPIGAHPGTAAIGAHPGIAPIGGRLGELTSAAERLAERIGAPTADLIERIEADARAADRGRARADAESAGTRATAVLLTFLPVGGLAIGYGIGADPLHVLLHTPVGAACAIAAALLQATGVFWAGRLTGGPVA
ncbi:type II secretion system F family protein [Actinoplanes sp. N902-109]|uniref:type II secretion system F family protein n=1 Tax=Actinoplanes sp. (strain N902-109) TaxID=649831 RepID=UPI00032940B7|nr:hypothetical protein [Actinoplanes sp. N902-109]AGL13964.1 hypothetical protein L083_0454 [Actinoplanes sp. N902-109]